MKRAYLRHIIAAIAIILSLTAAAQSDPARYRVELRNYKHEHLVRELDLSPRQAREFFMVYDAMEDSLEAFNDSVRAVEAEALALTDPTEQEIIRANTIIYSQIHREASIQQNAYNRIAEILTPKQMLRLKPAERSFNQTLMRQHRRKARLHQTQR